MGPKSSKIIINGVYGLCNDVLRDAAPLEGHPGVLDPPRGTPKPNFGPSGALFPALRKFRERVQKLDFDVHF